MNADIKNEEIQERISAFLDGADAGPIREPLMPDDEGDAGRILMAQYGKIRGLLAAMPSPEYSPELTERILKSAGSRSNGFSGKWVWAAAAGIACLVGLFAVPRFPGFPAGPALPAYAPEAAEASLIGEESIPEAICWWYASEESEGADASVSLDALEDLSEETLIEMLEDMAVEDMLAADFSREVFSDEGSAPEWWTADPAASVADLFSLFDTLNPAEAQAVQDALLALSAAA